MIEVAHAILEENGQVMDFSDLVNKIQTFLEKSDAGIRYELSQFYTDLNVDGSFISLGNNSWGLRSWYPFESVDEEVSSAVEDEDEEEGKPKRRKRKKVNAFLDMNDDDAIDYNDDDPEDADLSEEEEELLYEEEEEEEEEAEIKQYNSDLTEIGADDVDDEDTFVPSAEADLTIIEDDDFEDDDEFVEDGEEQTDDDF